VLIVDTADLAKTPYLQQFIKSYAPGEVLFSQGEAARSMLLIVTGRVLLLGEKGDDTYVAGLLEEGQILGEKVLFSKSPYQRAFTARAEIETTAIELTPADLTAMEKDDPSVMTALLRGILKVVAVRFERANQLVKMLRTSDVMERLIYVILYYRRCSAKPTPRGPEVMLSIDSIHHYVDLSREQISETIEALVNKGLMTPTKENCYLIPDEQALLTAGTKALKKLAA
jgi:CRP/FNR family transcriptional regulator, cyclic AMP receptor protein